MRIVDVARPDTIRRGIRIVVSMAIAVSLLTGGVAIAATSGQSNAQSRQELALPFRPRPRATGPFRVCPVDRPRHYRDDFGDARFAGGLHRHEGIDIFAGRGTPVRAPFPGTVERRSNWAGGLAVYVHGAHGFVYEAHLSAYGHTGRVAAGEIVGYVGNTGDAAGGATHDHFEWHPRGGPAVDAFDELNAVCGAQPKTFAVTLLWE